MKRKYMAFKREGRRGKKREGGKEMKEEERREESRRERRGERKGEGEQEGALISKKKLHYPQAAAAWEEMLLCKGGLAPTAAV